MPPDATTRSAPGVESMRSGLSDALMMALCTDPSRRSIATALVNRAAQQCQCARVSVGIIHASRPALLAVSDQVRIDTRRQLSRRLLNCMVEAAEAGQRVSWPPEQDPAMAPLAATGSVTATATASATEKDTSNPTSNSNGDAPGNLSAARALYDAEGGLPLLVVVQRGESVTVAVVLERSSGAALSLAQQLAVDAMLQPAMSLLALADAGERRGWQPALVDSLQRLRQRLSVQTLFHAERRVKAITLTALIVTGLTAGLIPVTDEVSARASIEAADRQILAAPQAGYILSAHARAGDSVTRNQLLARLDTRELELSLAQREGELAINEQSQAEAMATRNRIELGRLRADAKRIEAELSRVSGQLARSEVRAPFDGVVLQGDPGQSLGAAVAEGDMLFEVASADQYRLNIDIDERDIGQLSAHAPVRVRMSALPHTTFDATLDAVLPIAVATRGKTVFRQPATLSADTDALRPGMEGVARLDTVRRPLFSALTRSLRERLQLLAWRLGLIR